MDGKRCSAPYVTEEMIRQAFISEVNKRGDCEEELEEFDEKLWLEMVEYVVVNGDRVCDSWLWHDNRY